MTSLATNHLPEIPGGLDYTQPPELERGSPLSRWAFTFVLFYICVMLTQPQNRFLFFHPFRPAMLSMVAAMGLHFMACLQDNRPLIRMGPGTIIGLLLMVFGLLSNFVGPLQTHSGWNPGIDTLIKGCIVLILVEALAFNIYRVWVIYATIAIATLWWVKAGLRLGSAGAYWAGDRVMGPNVSLVQNPNAFAYFFCIMLPVYLFFYHQSRNKYVKGFFLFLTFAALYSILNTGSRTGVVVLFFLSLFLIWRYFWKYKLTLLLGAAGVVIVFGMVGALNVERFRTIPDSARAFFMGGEPDLSTVQGADEHSAVARRIKNRHTWNLIKEYPILGAGMWPNHRLFEAHYVHAGGVVHNELLMAGYQMGVFGMGLYTAMLAVMFFGARKIQMATSGWWPAMSNLAWTYKLMAVTIIVGGQFAVLPWSPIHFVLLGSVSALLLNLSALGVLEESAGYMHQPAPSIPALNPVQARTASFHG